MTALHILLGLSLLYNIVITILWLIDGQYKKPVDTDSDYDPLTEHYTEL